jgi:hypothetical protein
VNEESGPSLGSLSRSPLRHISHLEHPNTIQLADNTDRGGIILLMILTLDAKRRLALPASLVPAQPGDHFQAEFDPDEDAVVFRRLARNADWLKVLKACPVRMDDLPSRRREFPKRLKL